MNSQRLREHQEQLDQIRGRQLAIIRSLSSEDALAVLAAIPVTPDEECDVVANIQTRHALTEALTEEEP